MTDEHDKLEPSRLRNLAGAQKLAIWAVLANIISTIFFPLMLLAIPFMLYAVYRLVKAVADRPDRATASAVLAMLAMFIPLVSLIVLVVLNDKATSKLQLNGVKVGFMGAKSSDLPQTALPASSN